jgi:integrase/recombinase XerD
MTTLTDLAVLYLVDLQQAGRSPHTQRAYFTELKRFTQFYTGPLEGLDAWTLRQFLATRTGKPATRARTQAALFSFLDWARTNDLIPANPMERIARTHVEDRLPRGIKPEDVQKVLGVIRAPRDRLLFGLIASLGLRVSEALHVHVEDVWDRTDDEHIRVMGKGRRQRTVLLDDRGLVLALRKYLKATGYTSGPLFRATVNGRGGSLQYSRTQWLWASYCQAAGVVCTIHQLRHTHATELVNGGVHLETIRKRLGHKRIGTTLLYVAMADKNADAEIRAWRRKAK